MENNEPNSKEIKTDLLSNSEDEEVEPNILDIKQLNCVFCSHNKNMIVGMLLNDRLLLQCQNCGNLCYFFLTLNNEQRLQSLDRSYIN